MEFEYPPTPEQQAAIDAFAGRGEHLALEAGAGTGKTSTLKFLAAYVPRRADGTARTGLYLAYNASIAKEAKATFPGNTVSKTGHAHFMAGITPEQRRRLFDMPRQHGGEQAHILGISGPQRINEDVVYAPRQVARVVMDTVARFARSADRDLRMRHVPRQTRLEDPDSHATLAAIVLPYARKAWEDIMHPQGQLGWQHDYYRKAFHLADRRLRGDFLFVDEAQDSQPVVIELVKTHQREGMRIVAVGDRCQAINGWSGAVDAMDAFGGTRLLLSKSFRFGPAIAAEANKWLTMLDADLRITGHDPVGSVLGDLSSEVPDAILTRKNATAIAEAMRLLNQNVRVGLVKSVGQQVAGLAKAALQLKEIGATDHPELCAFTSWGQVQDYCEQDSGGSDLAVFVKLVDEHGADTILAAMERLAPEGTEQVLISTAHRSKGLEFDRVRIAGDFAPNADDDGEPEWPSREDMMLAYVAVTRAKKVLDPGSLRYVNDLLTKPRPTPTTVTARAGASNPLGRALYAEARRAGLLPTARELALADG